MNRILIADQDADTRLLYRDGLFRGEDVVEATDGRDALAKAFVHVPSLVLTELRLPFVDGVELCDILRRDVLTRFVPILVVTGDVRPAALERAQQAGADAVLVKPTSLELIRVEVRRLLEKSAALRQKSAAILQESAEQQRVSAILLARSIGRTRIMLSHAYRREVSAPPPPPAPWLVGALSGGRLASRRDRCGGGCLHA